MGDRIFAPQEEEAEAGIATGQSEPIAVVKSLVPLLEVHRDRHAVGRDVSRGQ